MDFLLNQPLRRKLVLVMMATTTAALVLAAAAVSTYQWFVFENSARRDVQAQAEILAANLSAAVEFTDAEQAARTLNVLRARADFELACVLDEKQQFLAGYTNGVVRSEWIWPATLPVGVRNSEGHLEIYQPVLHKEDRVGILYLRSRLSPGKMGFLHYLGLVGVVLGACWTITFWLATRLQRVVSQPIVDLSRTTREITERKDYSVRATRSSRDEVGDLIDGFNEMVAQIQARDTALQTAHDGLERRVAERTSELQKEVTERRRIEVALADEKERLDVTLKSLGEGVIATDCSAHIRVFNPVAERLTGWSAEEAIGRSLAEVLPLQHAVTRQRREDPVSCVLSARAPVEQNDDVVLLAREGGRRLISTNAAPMCDRTGQIIGVVFVFRDITERERTAQELSKARQVESISLLASGIAHDFNNILTVILGNISMAGMGGPLAGPAAEALAQAERATIRASDLTRQLLTFAKGGEPAREPVALAGVIQETLAFVLHGSNVTAEMAIAPDLWQASVDRSQIEQVIHNLALNAVRAMPTGGVVRVSAANETRETAVSPVLGPGRYLVISIEDAGGGLPPEQLARVFDPYFKTRTYGSGLGLATSYSIVRKHDGDITVQSELGRGTIFQVFLPAAAVRRPEAPPPELGEPVPGQGRILLMDDEASIRDLTGRLLNSLGYEVITAAHGVEALRIYEEARAAGRPFDAVVLDLSIPGGLGGQQTLQRLRAIDPAVKAIASSGSADPSELDTYRQFGFTAIVPKPYHLNEFSRALKAVLESGKIG